MFQSSQRISILDKKNLFQPEHLTLLYPGWRHRYQQASFVNFHRIGEQSKDHQNYFSCKKVPSTIYIFELQTDNCSQSQTCGKNS